LIGDIANLSSYEQESFDFISVLGVLEHLVRPDLALREISRLLKKDGLLFIQTPDTSSIPARCLGRFWFCYAPVEHIHFFDKKNLTLLLQKFGLTPIAFQAHWKKLELWYLVAQLSHFGSRAVALHLEKIRQLLPEWSWLNGRAAFYGGEMIGIASKNREVPEEFDRNCT